MKTKSLIIIPLFFSSALVFGQSNSGISGPRVVGQDTLRQVITTAVPFLTITPDSRSSGMGDVGVAISPDANSPYWNTGKLAFIETSYGISGSYSPWLAKIIPDMSIVYLSGYYKFGEEQAVATSLKYFDLGEIEFRDATGMKIGRYNPREFAFDFTYSRKLSQVLGIGGSLRYIHSNLVGSGQPGSETKPGNSVAVDVGIYYTKPLVSRNGTLSLGANVSNIGSKLTYSDADNKDFIPTNIRLGGAYTTSLDPYNTLTFALDINKLMVPSLPSNSSMLSGIFSSFTDARGGFKEEIRELSVATGLEYWYQDYLAGRLGFFYEDKNKGNRKYLTAGVGIRYQRMGLDVSYLVPVNKREVALAETLRFTLMVNFEKTTIQKNESVTD